MTDEDIAKIQDAVAAQVKVTVNGKIDRLQSALDAHVLQHEEDQKIIKEQMEQLKPALELVSGGKIAGRLLSWTAGIAVGYAAIRGFIVK